jgi:DNA-binding CsgD family transcriptional regulator
MVTHDFETRNPKDAAGWAIKQRLDIIIALLLRLIERDRETLSAREQILMLSNLGLRPVEIAGILGKKTSYINKELSGLRKKGGK